MITRLIRGSLNSQADDNPELGSNSECRDFIPGILKKIKRKSRLQTFYGSENYSSKKSVLERVRWFESIPAHQNTSFDLYFYLNFFTNMCFLDTYMYFSTNKEKCNTGLGIAIAYYTSNGYTVSTPLNDTQDYDLIVDKKNRANFLFALFFIFYLLLHLVTLVHLIQFLLQ